MKLDRKVEKSRGFTLIELLVVIAIITLLAAILFPVFATAREKARQSACLSNTKQLATAMQMYVQDADEMFPCGVAYYGYPGRGWVYSLYPYFKSVNVMLCPSDSNAGASTGWSYAYNMNIAGYLNPVQHSGWDVGTSSYVNVGNAITMAQFNAPSKTVAAFEITEHNFTHTAVPVDSDYKSIAGCGIGYRSTLASNQQYYATGYMWGDSAANSSAYVMQARHNGGACFVMADGHAKWFQSKQVAGGKSANFGSTAQPSTYCEADGSGGNPASGTDCSQTFIDATFSWY